VFANGQRADIVPAGTSICPKVIGQNPIKPQTLDGLTFCNARQRVFTSDPDLTSENGVLVLANVPRFGNSPRNFLRGKGQSYVNASLFKSLVITERLKVELRAQFYNLFNHLNGFHPDNNLTDGTFGQDTSEQRRRQLEFGMRILF
jgi:hypothetical protein